MALFQKTNEELREAFVRNRFAEAAVFRRPDIDEWIKGEYTNEVPSNADTDAWRTLLKHDELVDFIHGAAILLLQKYATTLHDLGYPRHEPTGYSHLLPLVERGLYWGKDNRGIYLHPNPVNTQAVYLVRGKAPEDHAHSLTFDCAGRNNLKDIHETVLEIMFAEWWRGDPKRDAARQYLCEAADIAIRREHAKAEHDFDTAVAVSVDGTKIVHADWVVVVPVTEDNRYWFRAMCARSLPVWPASTFTGEKIRRSNHMLRSEFPKPGEMWGFNSPGEVPTHESAVKTGYIVARRETHEFVHQWQIYCEMRLPSGMQRLLFTTPNFCPFPLPEGGVEMTV